MPNVQHGFSWAPTPIDLSVDPEPPDEPTALIASVSGGVDSDATALWLRKRYHDRPIILWHAWLELDWEQTPEHISILAETLGNCTIITLQAIYELTGELTPSGYNATTMRRIHDVGQYGPAQDNDPAALTTLMDLWVKARNGMPPSDGIRYCTEYKKSRLFESWAIANRELLGARPLLVSGERWAESHRRAKNVRRSEWRVPLKPSRQWPDGWGMVWYRPVVDQALHQVTRSVVDAGIPLHPGYFIQGETEESMLDPKRDERGRARLSCIGCFYMRRKHIAVALQNESAVVLPALQMIRQNELATGKTWQPDGAIIADAPCGI